MRYPLQYKATENAIVAAIDAVEDALCSARGGRSEHVQALDRSREALKEALRRLRDARPNEIW